MVSIDYFRQGLLEQMDRAANSGLIEILSPPGHYSARSVAIPDRYTGCLHVVMPCRLK